MANTFNIVEAMTTQFVQVQLPSVSGWAPRVKIEGSGEIVANSRGDDPDTVSDTTQDIFPLPYSKLYRAMRTAFNAMGSEFRDATIPLGVNKTANGKERAVAGTRALHHKFLPGLHNKVGPTGTLRQSLEDARDMCARNIAYDVRQLSYAGVFATFDFSLYPDETKIRDGWYYKEMIVRPFADLNHLRQMGLTPEVVETIQSSMAAELEVQYRQGQQTTVADTMKYIRKMAVQLEKLGEWAKRGDGRQPSIHKTLVTNVTQALEKLRTYAIPTDPVGAALLAQAQEIEDRLLLRTVSVDDLKARPKDAGGMARDVHEAADSLASLADSLFNGESLSDAPVARTEPTPPPAPEIIEKIETVAKAEPELDLDDIFAELFV